MISSDSQTTKSRMRKLTIELGRLLDNKERELVIWLSKKEASETCGKSYEAER
ncbi:hypothetical protein K8O68_18090 [Salipaludibacillus sp. CUR1]|uniref:hypothetical protein n=1 Tax=Salipaludibacillus sp. CUR1 TaxID=2820003 RepID=UPI001E2AC1B7|nr:hypothetical protein [Salipaludibacillus sp. CUR1]MCE7794293.1 hypothetical protein [Salipaludibacillus sp. CUR1]